MATHDATSASLADPTIAAYSSPVKPPAVPVDAVTGQLSPSWGDTLRMYKIAKANVSWKPEEVKVNRVNRYQKSREERVFDPVLQVFRDPAKDNAVQTQQQEKTLRQMNRARDAQLRYSQTFDIVTHVPRIAEPPVKIYKRQTPDTRTSYNIISNKDFSQHHYAPPHQRPPPERVPPPPTPLATTVEFRDYSIITNKYYQEHDRKAAVDKQVATQKAAERYWQTHDFNPINCAYYDESKEQSFQQTREDEKVHHGEGWQEKLPKTLRAGEGIAYNIINMDVRHSERFADYHNRTTKALKSRIGAEVEARLHVRGDEEAAIAESRSLARIPEHRFQESIRHGYDVVTNQPFNGVDSNVVHPHRGTVHKSVWQRCQEELNAPLSTNSKRTFGQSYSRAAPNATLSTTGGATGGAARPATVPVSSAVPERDVSYFNDSVAMAANSTPKPATAAAGASRPPPSAGSAMPRVPPLTLRQSGTPAASVRSSAFD